MYHTKRETTYIIYIIYSSTRVPREEITTTTCIAFDRHSRNHWTPSAQHTHRTCFDHSEERMDYFRKRSNIYPKIQMGILSHWSTDRTQIVLESHSAIILCCGSASPARHPESHWTNAGFQHFLGTARYRLVRRMCWWIEIRCPYSFCRMLQTFSEKLYHINC